MDKLAIVSMVLLLAGIGLAFGQAGSCICPNNTTCSQTGCTENCTASCALGENATASCAIGENAASSCAANCPKANCGSAGSCQASCAVKSVAGCGAANK